MILLLGGTTEGLQVAKILDQHQYPFCLSVATKLGEKVYGQQAETVAGTLDQAGMEAACRRLKVRLIIDATHPFAAQASANAISAGRKLNIPYLRFERRASGLPSHPLLRRVEDFAAALDCLTYLGAKPLLAVGVKNLPLLLPRFAQNGQHPVAKVLPLPDNLSKLQELSHPAKDTVAFWGSGTYRLLRSIIHEFKVTGLLTKESGWNGGEVAKVKAFLNSGLPVLVIQRPAILYPELVSNLSGLKKYLKEVYHG